MTDKELLDKAIYWFKVIAEDMNYITTGNLPHCACTTKGRAIRAYEFLEKHREPVSEDFEKEMDKYFPTVFSKDMDSGEPRFTTWFRALRKTARHFTEWKKEQMINSAKQSKIVITSGGILLSDLKIEDFDYADKVKVIIIKENKDE